MLFVWWIGVCGIIARFPRSGIKHVIAQVFEGTAMKGLSAGLGFDFDGAGTVAAVLRAIVGGENFEFGDSLDVGIDVQCRIGAVVHVVAAIEFPVVVLGAATVNAERNVSINPDSPFVGTSLVHDA